MSVSLEAQKAFGKVTAFARTLSITLGCVLPGILALWLSLDLTQGWSIWSHFIGGVVLVTIIYSIYQHIPPYAKKTEFVAYALCWYSGVAAFVQFGMAITQLP